MARFLMVSERISFQYLTNAPGMYATSKVRNSETTVQFHYFHNVAVV